MRRDTDHSFDFYSLVGLGWILPVLVATVIGPTSIAKAASAFDSKVPERWGEFQWLSPWIETGFTYRDPREGQFFMGSASFGGRWTGWASRSSAPGQTRVEAQIAIGTKSLILRPSRYAPLSSVERSTDPALVDAFAGVGGTWGNLRIGLLPLTFGLEEGTESERRWLRPLIVRRGLIGLRDIGIAYSVSAGGFYSDWFVHNGEGGEDRDREIWMTGRWEYRLRTDRVQWRWGASGQVGRTTPESTHPTGTTASAFAELDPDVSARLRYGGVHMASDWVIGEGARGSDSDRRFGFEFEAFAGEVLQDPRTRRLRAARLDIEYEPFASWGFLLRGEALDPDTQASRDMIHEVGLGVQYYFLSGALKRSLRGLLVLTKEWNEAAGIEPERHRVEFVMRFSPDLPE